MITLNIEKNRNRYIELLIKKYETLADLNDEYFINFIMKIIEYSHNNKIHSLDLLLPKFKQNITIYLKIQDIFNKDKEIQEKIADLSYKNLNMKNLFELIRKMKKNYLKEYFNNLKQSIITYDEFLDLKDSKNIKFLQKLIETNNEIPESNYLYKSRNVLNSIYDKLTTYNETKEIYLHKLFNKKNKFIYIKRFKLFKLIKVKNKSYSEQAFINIKNKFIQFGKKIEKAVQISNLLNIYYKNSLEIKIEKINEIYKDFSKKEGKANKWIINEDLVNNYIKDYDEKAKLIKKIKGIDLFNIIYEKILIEDESYKFNKSIKIIDKYKYIFNDIDKVDRAILNIWVNKSNKNFGIFGDLIKLKYYFDIKSKINLSKISKNILLINKEQNFISDINYLLNYINLFKAKETNLSSYYKQKMQEFNNKGRLNFGDLQTINFINTNLKLYRKNGNFTNF